MSANNQPVSITFTASLPKLVGGIVVVCAFVLLGVVYFVKWGVDHTVVGINRQLDSLSESMGTQISDLRQDITELNRDVVVVENQVGEVDKGIAVADKDSENVKEEVVEVKEEVGEVKTEMEEVKDEVVVVKSEVGEVKTQMANELKTIKSALAEGFKYNTAVKKILEDERLSMSFPIEFFTEGEPSMGAAKDSVSDLSSYPDNPTPAFDTIANYCLTNYQQRETCYYKYLKKYANESGR